MGAVKTNRRGMPYFDAIVFNGTCQTIAEAERQTKETNRQLQAIGFTCRGYDNNRRKLHGKPVIRRVMS